MDVSKYANISEEMKEKLIKLLPENTEPIKITRSLCPQCVEGQNWNEMTKPAIVFKENGKVMMLKNCEKHGPTKEVYWSDYDMYKRAERFQDPGIKIENPQVTVPEDKIECPKNCGLCSQHESHTNLLNMAITNRCDLSCWYCFFYAKPDTYVYEPSIDQIKKMLENARNTKPVGANAVQLTGGEPLLREDLLDIINTAKGVGYDHVQLNTNTIKLSQDAELCEKIRKAGVNTVYMSFDGVTPQTNPKNYWEIPKAVENFRNAGLGGVLVPTVIGGLNDHELGDIINFAKGNIDVIRGVNFQPVSFVGSMPEKLRAKQRITIPDAIKKLEEQTDGQIAKEDFYPVPCVKSVTDFIEALKENPKYRLSTHFACGAATYAFMDGNKLVPITRFFDAEGFFEYLDELSNSIGTGNIKKLAKTMALGKLFTKINSFIDKEKKPKDLNLIKLLKSAFTGADYKGLTDFHHKSLFIGMMHFQDPYNWDIDRVHKCTIHYGSPDGRIVPFCTFNVIPGLYRDNIQKRFSTSAPEWEKKLGRKIEDDKYKRSFTEEDKKKIDEFYRQSIKK